MTDIEKSKSDSMFGQAEGVRGNYKVSKDIYSQNAEYGEESKQQSTNSKIKTLGSIDNAVALDVTDASIKAQQLSGSTSGMMGVASNIEGQQEFVNKTLAGARDAEHRNQMLRDFENSGWTDAQGIVSEGAFIKARAMLGANNMMSSNSMGIGGSIVSGTIGATSDNTTVKVDGVDSSANGKTTTLNNDVVTLHNTDAKTRNQLENTNGNAQEAANRLATRDRLDHESNLKNQVLDAGTDLIHKLTPQEQQENTAAIAGTIGTMVASVAGTYAASQIDKKFNPELDENGNKTGRGAWGGKISDMGDRLFGGKPSPDAPNSSTYESDHSQPNETQSNRTEQTTHNKSFNSDVDSMPNNGETVNSKKGGWGNFIGERFNAASEAMDGGGSWKTKLSLAASAAVFGTASETFANISQLADPTSFFTGTSTSTDADLKPGMYPAQSAAPQHQGFTTMPIGHHTAQAISADMQQQAAQAQITTANNIQALTAIAPNSVTPNRSYVGFTMQDAEQNPVSFTTDKASRNVMMNGSAYEF